MMPSTRRTLLFDFDGIPELRRRSAQHETFYCETIASAEWSLALSVPAQPEPLPARMLKSEPPPPGVTPFRSEYLLAVDDYERATSAYARALPELAFAYRATGEEKYADAALAWLHMFVERWRDWGSLDSLAVKIMSVTALGCDWLAERVPPELSARAKYRAEKCFEQAMEEWYDDIIRIGSGNMDLSRRYVNDRWWYGHCIGNHWWYNSGKLGLAALWLGRKEEAGAIARQYRNLIGLSLGPDGDYIDKPHYLLWAFRWAFPFWLAAEREGGPPLLSEPLLGKAAMWLTAMRSTADPGPRQS